MTTLTPILTKFWDVPQSWTLETYEQYDGYQALRAALGIERHLLFGHSVGGGMARSGRRTLARFGRPYPAIRRFACGVACRGAHPLPGRGAAVSRRC